MKLNELGGKIYINVSLVNVRGNYVDMAVSECNG